MNKIAVIGSGSWGTALAIQLSKQGREVTMWARTEESALILNSQRENKKYLPDIEFPDKLVVTSDLEYAISNKQLVLLVVPSHAIREIVQKIKSLLSPQTIIVNTAKGLESETLLRMSQVIKTELDPIFHGNIAILSGPNHAEEVGRGIPSATVVAADHEMIAETVQNVFMAPNFRVYTSQDVLGVELGGALKNIVAIGAGMSDGLNFGDNTKASLLTRGLSEIVRLGMAMGADPLTFAGLSGLGDLVATCTSRHSRNRKVGMELAIGKNLNQILKEMNMVAEGIKTTNAAYRLSKEYGVEMPITEETYAVLFKGKYPEQAVISLMNRGPKSEIKEIDFIRKDKL